MSGEILLERPPVDWERHKGDKRPKILPPPGETWRNPTTKRKVGHRYYTRVTTYADAITESYNLTNWKLAKLLIGLGQRADYVRQAAALTMDDRDRDARDELVAKVLDAAGPDAAGLGTALHSLTERLDRGEDIGTPPEEMLPDLAAYVAVTEGVLGIRWREPRTVCDALECAGTPDTIATVSEPPPTGEGLPVCDCPPDRLRVVDTKTGSIRYPGKMSTQLAIYSRSDRYDPATGERTPLDVCPHWGVIVHLPVETGEAALFWLDLEHGWRGAELCGPVRTWHKAKADDILRPFATINPVKVVDGEVTRIEPRLASTRANMPPATEPADVTDALAEALTASLAERGVPVAGLEVESERDDQGDEAALHEDLTDPLDGRVAEAVHRALVGDEADRPAPLPEELEATRRPGLPIAPGPDSCAHSGGRTMRGNALVCRDCGEPAGFGATTAEPEVNLGPAVIGTTWLEGMDAPTTAEPEVIRQLDEVLAEEVDAEAERVGWPGVDDVPVEELASGPDSDATDDEGDPLADEILACVTTRDLELLGTQRWRDWQQSHRDLAVGTHAELEEREAAARPRAAAEAAILSAGTLEELNAVMGEIADAPWVTSDLLTLAEAQWRQLKRDASKAGHGATA